MFGSAVQLAQSRPANTNAAVLYTNAENRVELTRLHICDVGGAGATFRLFVDQAGGSTFDQTTALYYDVAIAANSTFEWAAPFAGGGWVLGSGAQIAIRSGTGNALNFTLWGVAQRAR